MLLFGQLVCAECHKILSYPIGAISCCCRNCNRVNAAEHLCTNCGGCGQDIAVPINTLSFLCPCCAAVTDIPEEFLPLVDESVDIGTENNSHAKAIYVAYPARQKDSKSAQQTNKTEVVAEKEKSREELEECASGGEGNVKRGEKVQSYVPMTMVVGTRIL